MELLLIWMVISLPSFSFGVSWESEDGLITMELPEYSTIKSKRSAIELYCKSLLSDSSQWRIYFSKSGNWSDRDWQQTFDSRQSLFLQALCWSFKDENWKSTFVDWSMLSGVFKWDVVRILSLKQMSDWKDLCSLASESALWNCDLSIYATKIFDWIMSDLFKVKYAQVLNVDSVEKFNVKNSVKSFMSWYYSITDDYEDIKKEYSKTVSILEKDQKYYKNVIDKIKLIDNSKLAKLVQDSGCPVDWNVVWLNFVACALHSSQWNRVSITPAFVTLIYNELLQYQLFISYYKDWLNYSKIKNNEDNKDNNEKLKHVAELYDLEGYFSLQKEAFQLAQHNLEDFSMTYPVHIWISMYAEKIEKFRKNFAQIITIFYSLSEKLQNVQLPS